MYLIRNKKFDIMATQFRILGGTSRWNLRKIGGNGNDCYEVFSVGDMICYQKDRRFRSGLFTCFLLRTSFILLLVLLYCVRVAIAKPQRTRDLGAMP